MFNSLLKKAISQQIKIEVERRFKNQSCPAAMNSTYHRLCRPIERWNGRDYVRLAEVVGLSTSTVKRLFACKGFEDHLHFSSSNQQKIIDFLGYLSWDELEKHVLLQIVKQILIDKGLDEQNLSGLDHPTPQALKRP